jgi:hypothetical protein
MKNNPVILKLPSEVTLTDKMPWQAIQDALWTLNMGIKSVQGDVVEVSKVAPKPASCSKCDAKAIFKRGPFFYCCTHYMEFLQDDITKNFGKL